jgi:hypothetical protein
MLIIPPLHLFIKQEARQAANRLLGNGCSYVPNFGQMIDEMLLLLAPRDKFMTLNIYSYSRKFSVDFPTREDWSTECVDLVAPDGFVVFTDGSICEGRAGAGEYQGIICLRFSYYGLSIRNICYFGVFGILHFGGHCQQSSINLL